MIVNLTDEQREAAKKWAELRDKHPDKSRDEILELESRKSKVQIFTIEEKAFVGEGTEALATQTQEDKEKYL